MIDWSELVADAAQNLPKNEANDHCSYSTCRNKQAFSETVGTAETRANTGFQGVCSDVPSVPQDFEWSRVEEHEKHNPSSLFEPAGGVVQRQSAPHNEAPRPSCRTCAHLSRLGHCGGCDDLPPAYTPGHPLRKLPDDGGASCPAWRLHPAMVGADLLPSARALSVAKAKPSTFKAQAGGAKRRP